MGCWFLPGQRERELAFAEKTRRNPQRSGESSEAFPPKSASGGFDSIPNPNPFLPSQSLLSCLPPHSLTPHTHSHTYTQAHFVRRESGLQALVPVGPAPSALGQGPPGGWRGPENVALGSVAQGGLHADSLCLIWTHSWADDSHPSPPMTQFTPVPGDPPREGVAFTRPSPGLPAFHPRIRVSSLGWPKAGAGTRSPGVGGSLSLGG